jgi:hypothetical protein
MDDLESMGLQEVENIAAEARACLQEQRQFSRWENVDAPITSL